MNKVFKVVWNEVRASYMVCDENSMTRGKPKSVKTAVLAASVAAMMGFGSIAAAADPVIVEGQTYENVSVTESSNHPLKAQVSATADDASSLTVKDSTFRNNSMTLEDTSGVRLPWASLQREWMYRSAVRRSTRIPYRSHRMARILMVFMVRRSVLAMVI